MSRARTQLISIGAMFVLSLAVAMPMRADGDCAGLYIYVDISGSMKRQVSGQTALQLVLETLAKALSKERTFELDVCEDVQIIPFGTEVYDAPERKIRFHRPLGDPALEKRLGELKNEWVTEQGSTDVVAVLNNIASTIESDTGTYRKLFVIASDFAHDIESMGKDADVDIKMFKDRIRAFSQETKGGLSNRYRNMVLCFFVPGLGEDNDYRREQVTRELGLIIGDDMLFDSVAFDDSTFRRVVGRALPAISLSVTRSKDNRGYDVLVMNFVNREISGVVKVDCPRQPEVGLSGEAKREGEQVVVLPHSTEVVTILDAENRVFREVAGTLDAGNFVRCNAEFLGGGPDRSQGDRPLTNGQHFLYLGTFMDVDLVKAEPIINLGSRTVRALVRVRGQLADPVHEWPTLKLSLLSRREDGDVEISQSTLSGTDDPGQDLERVQALRPESWKVFPVTFKLNEESAWLSLCTHDPSPLVFMAVAVGSKGGQGKGESVFHGLRDESVISEGRDAHSLTEKVIFPLVGAFVAVIILLVIYPRPMLEKLEVALAVFGLLITAILVLVHDVFPGFTNLVEDSIARHIPFTAIIILAALAGLFIFAYIRGLHEAPLSERAIRILVRSPALLECELKKTKNRKIFVPVTVCVGWFILAVAFASQARNSPICVFQRGYVPIFADLSSSGWGGSN